MIIGIDGSEANEKVRVGSSEYAYQLLHSLYRINNISKIKNKYLIFIKQEKINNLPAQNQWWSYKIIPASKLWILKKLVPRLNFGAKLDLFFSPTHYLPIFTRIPQVCTIHDLGYLMFSEQFRPYDFWQLKLWTAISIIISKYIIAVSESTKKDIVRHYPFSSNKIKVIYHGIDHNVFNQNISNILVRHIKNKYKIRKDYILFLGTLKPSKNIEGIVKAFSLFIDKKSKTSKNYQLVIAGKKGWLYESIFKLVKEKGIENKVIFTDYVTLEEKRALYKGAYVLVSPSFWEGFGIHILEAMACGTPVVVSKKGSLNEIAGKVGIYVDPNDENSIYSGIDKLVSMSVTEYNKLSNKCIEHSKLFTWEKTAQETMQLFNEIVK